jgi:protoporphyrin/coproporphyrin ferrochelatase
MSRPWSSWSGVAKTAIILLNLGGPDRLEAIQPFLFNLFNDKAIIALPQPARWFLAKLIARRRSPLARTIYGKIGGSSPLLENTIAQAKALEDRLGENHRCFVTMRHWHPRAAETAAEVAAWRPNRMVIMPLYPQYSTTTTASSLADWYRAAAAVGLDAPTSAICCFPRDPGLIAAAAALVRDTLEFIPRGVRFRMLFSAHGLPKKIVEGGDPYQWQVEETVGALRAALALPGLDSVICYQSRVGPLAWIGPSTDEEIRRAAGEGLGIVVVPVAFVSEHSETLVELDIEYRHLAEKAGSPGYWRVPTVGTHPAFIDGLSRLAATAIAGKPVLASSIGGRFCPSHCRKCPLAEPRVRSAA